MKQIKYITGFFFICLGVLTNRLILEKVASPYAIVELNYRIPIILINLCLITLGFFIIVAKREHFYPAKLVNLYKFLAFNFFAALLLFLLVNIFLYTFLVIKDVGFYKKQIFYSYNKPLKEIYPDLMGRDVNLLLYETWSRPYVYEPYTQFKERPFKGKYVNVHEAGFRLTKNQGPWPPDLKNTNIFLFGGSTVFNYGVPDDETIASYLQGLFSTPSSKKKVCVYNFGRGNYFSSQERILFEELIASGYKPDIAVFIDGLNDFYYCNNEPLFTDRLRKFIDYKGKFLLVDLPLVNLIKDIKKVADVQNENDNDNDEKLYNDEKLIKKAIGRYLSNKRIVETLANAYNVKVLFVWQPVPTYKYDLKYHIFSGMGFGRFLYSKYGYVYMADFVKKNNLGKNFLWLADIQENVKKSLYVDIDHYSGEFSRNVAKEIYNFIVNNPLYIKGNNE